MPELTIHDDTVHISGILLDKDGTVMDFVSTWGSWSEQLFHHFTKRVREALPAQAEAAALVPADLSPLWGTLHDEQGTVNGYDVNGPLAMGTMEELISILTWQGYRLGLSWAAAKELVAASKREADETLRRLRPARPIRDVEPFLAACREAGIPLAIVTADETDSAEEHLSWMGLRSYFDAVIGNDQAENGKPFPDLMQIACSRLGIACSETVIIGDTNGDMRMGLAAGSNVRIGLAPDEAADAASLMPDATHLIHGYTSLRIRSVSHER
ncbi:phosphoglycolate phosphatase [Paenibacillus phyllosphaerae]|uniref:Phosphoglycolate phosphatase n=1 Tax=Paenibacillus phyllosphaerae TaxID=274593 RepID=A0A7W5B0W7_9BACL|nr:HAD-IA family hydrolase [Paenibacillus phyllosphaerae]MBB3112410.1 phosphoglycolate phosphatase [Paenibacillus phyllosphaerae]